MEDALRSNDFSSEEDQTLGAKAPEGTSASSPTLDQDLKRLAKRKTQLEIVKLRLEIKKLRRDLDS